MCGGVWWGGGYRCITEFKPKPDFASAGILHGWGCDKIVKILRSPLLFIYFKIQGFLFQILKFFKTSVYELE